MSPYVTVIVPMYNEEDTIGRLLRDIDRTLKPRYESYEILVINDGSDDNSLDICNSLRKEINSLRIYNMERRGGKTLAIVRGLELTQGKILSFIDADYQYDPKDLPKVIDKVGEGYDLCSGIRKNRRDPSNRILFSKAFNAINRVLFGIRVKDINCGMKAFRRDSISKIKIKYTKTRWFIDIEVLARSISKNFKISEVDIGHFERKRGKSKINLFRIVSETLIYGLFLKLEMLAGG